MVVQQGRKCLILAPLHDTPGTQYCYTYVRPVERGATRLLQLAVLQHGMALSNQSCRKSRRPLHARLVANAGAPTTEVYILLGGTSLASRCPWWVGMDGRKTASETRLQYGMAY